MRRTSIQSTTMTKNCAEMSYFLSGVTRGSNEVVLISNRISFNRTDLFT